MMRKVVYGWVLASILLVSPAWAIQGERYAEETITVADSSIGITANLCRFGGSIYTGAMLQVKAQAIYWNLDTATPDSNDYEAQAGDYIELDRDNVARLRMIRQGASSATVKVTCFTDTK